MTSSFGNVIGTPRDELPDISKTNYLETEPDMTKAVNEQIDANIADTKQFFDDMMKIEENRAKTFDRRLKAIVDITGKVDDFAKALAAQQASDEIDDQNFKGDEQAINDFKELKKAENEQDFSTLTLGNFFKSQLDRTDGEVDLRATRDDVLSALGDIEFAYNPDGSLRNFLRGIKPHVMNTAIDSVLASLGHKNIKDPQEALRVAEFAQRLVRNKIHVDAFNAGYDITGGRYKKNFLNIVQPNIDKYLTAREYIWESNYTSQYERNIKETLDNKIKDYAAAINLTPAQGQDLELFTDKTGQNLLSQIEASQFAGAKDSKFKSLMYFGETLANFAKNDPSMIPHLQAVLNNLPYSDRGTKTDFRNIEEYQASIDVLKEPKRYSKVTQFIRTIEKAIEDAQDIEANDIKNAHASNVTTFLDTNYKPLIERAAKRPDRSVTQAEAFQLLTMFTGDETLYNPNDPDKKIPQEILTLFTKVEQGAITEGVAKRLEFASLINDQSKIILQMVKDRKRELGQDTTITTDDLFLAKQLEDILAAEIVEGTTGEKTQLDLEIEAGGGVDSFIKTRVQDIKAKFEAGEYDGLGRRLYVLGTEQAEALRKAYKADKSLLFSKDVHEGEAPFLEKALLYVRSGGKLEPEVLQYFKNFRKSGLVDDQGNLLTAQEIMFERLRATGAFVDDDTFGFRIKSDMDYLTLEEKKYLVSGGTHHVHNIATKDGGVHAENMLNGMESIYANGKYGNRKSGYEYYNTGPAMTNNYRTNIGANIFGPDIRARNLEYIAKVAERHPKVQMGRYGLTGEQFMEIYNQPGFKRAFTGNQKFDENFQDFMAFELMRYKLSRNQSIRGMEFSPDGRLVTKLNHFNQQEIEAFNTIFPQLKGMSFLQLHNLSGAIAEVFLTDVEKGLKTFNEAEADKKRENSPKLFFTTP